ncbi:hypothetical protein [Streptomyces sp. NPDC005407]|uniref:PGAP1-like alpha/beta domain-containing protein n=1 Tax=Streptomyces sp. NPDC005407 TaxID=3155340 RepID=UPI0033A9E773
MPDTADTVVRFLASDTLTRLEMIKGASEAESLRAWMSDEAFAEYLGLAEKIDMAHLAAPVSSNIIFVPGVMGSLLTSRKLGGVWWVDFRSRKHLNDLRLAPDGLMDANPSHDVASFAVDVSYESFLTAVLCHDDFGHIGFHYDWRKPLYVSAERLRETILATYAQNERRPVHVVAHSMGGLLVRVTLMRNPELWRCIDKVVFLGTPHYGSPAIAGYLKNHLWGFDLMFALGRYLDRDTFRSLWGF